MLLGFSSNIFSFQSGGGDQQAIVLERSSVRRFEQAMNDYATYRRNARIKKWAKRAGVVAGSVAVTAGVVGAGTFAYNKRSWIGDNLGLKEKKVTTDNNNSSAIKSHLKDYGAWITVTVATSIILGFITGGVNEVYPFLRRQILGNKFVGSNRLNLRTQQLVNSLNLLQRSISTMNLNYTNPTIFSYTQKSIIGSFNQLVHSVEKLFAALVYEAKASGKHEIAAQLEQETCRIFEYCNALAGKLETDLNRERFVGFSLDTYQAVMSMSHLFLGVVNDYPVL